MPKEVEKLFQTASEDPTLQQQLENADTLTEVVKIGAENGFTFTEEEAKGFLAASGLIEGEEGELSEEALEAVAGGWGGWRFRLRFEAGN